MKEEQQGMEVRLRNVFDYIFLKEVLQVLVALLENDSRLLWKVWKVY